MFNFVKKSYIITIVCVCLSHHLISAHGSVRVGVNQQDDEFLYGTFPEGLDIRI